MPHFVIDCSENLINEESAQEIIKCVNIAAVDSGLFATSGPGVVKVRINPFRYHNASEENDDFVHVFAHIMEGRTIEQKMDLSKSIVSELKELLPNVLFISMNVYEFEKATYCNRAMLES